MKIERNDNKMTAVINYAVFLSRKLELWMFVPCKLVKGVWVVLEEPKNHSEFLILNASTKNTDNYFVNLAYKEAKSRCLFEGIEYVEAKHEGSYNIVRICKSLSTINYPNFWEGVTMEKLIPYNLTLTESAKKKYEFN